MTNENPWKSFLDHLPENATVARGLVHSIQEAAGDGLVRPEHMTAGLVAAVAELELRILALEGNGEPEITSGGIQVFDPDDRQWER